MGSLSLSFCRSLSLSLCRSLCRSLSLSLLYFKSQALDGFKTTLSVLAPRPSRRTAERSFSRQERQEARDEAVVASTEALYEMR